MLGELFFKDNEEDRDDDNDDLEEYTKDLEHLPYQVIQKNEVKSCIQTFPIFHNLSF